MEYQIGNEKILHYICFEPYIKDNLGGVTSENISYIVSYLNTTKNNDNVIRLLRDAVLLEARSKSYSNGRIYNLTTDSMAMASWNDVAGIQSEISSSRHSPINFGEVNNAFDVLNVLLKYTSTDKLFDSIKDNGILISGCATISYGHAICIYYKKIADKYEIVLFNSGDGIQFHENLPEKKPLLLCMVRSVITIEQMKLLFKIIYIFNQKIYLNIELYYRLMKQFFTTSESHLIQSQTTEMLKQIEYSMPQLVGTCTYHSIILAIQYIIVCHENRPIADYHDFKLNLQKYALSEILDNHIKFYDAYGSYRENNIYHVLQYAEPIKYLVDTLNDQTLNKKFEIYNESRMNIITTNNDVNFSAFRYVELKKKEIEQRHIENGLTACLDGFSIITPPKDDISYAIIYKLLINITTLCDKINEFDGKIKQFNKNTSEFDKYMISVVQILKHCYIQKSFERIITYMDEMRKIDIPNDSTENEKILNLFANMFRVYKHLFDLDEYKYITFLLFTIFLQLNSLLRDVYVAQNGTLFETEKVDMLQYMTFHKLNFIMPVNILNLYSSIAGLFFFFSVGSYLRQTGALEDNILQRKLHSVLHMEHTTLVRLISHPPQSKNDTLDTKHDSNHNILTVIFGGLSINYKLDIYGPSITNYKYDNDLIRNTNNFFTLIQLNDILSIAAAKSDYKESSRAAYSYNDMMFLPSIYLNPTNLNLATFGTTFNVVRYSTNILYCDINYVTETLSDMLRTHKIDYFLEHLNYFDVHVVDCFFYLIFRLKLDTLCNEIYSEVIAKYKGIKYPFDRIFAEFNDKTINESKLDDMILHGTNHLSKYAIYNNCDSIQSIIDILKRKSAKEYNVINKYIHQFKQIPTEESIDLYTSNTEIMINDLFYSRATLYDDDPYFYTEHGGDEYGKRFVCVTPNVPIFILVKDDVMYKCIRLDNEEYYYNDIDVARQLYPRVIKAIIEISSELQFNAYTSLKPISKPDAKIPSYKYLFKFGDLTWAKEKPLFISYENTTNSYCAYLDKKYMFVNRNDVRVHSMILRWAFNIPQCYIVTADDRYYILIINNKQITKIYPNMWSDGGVIESQFENDVHLIEINYNGTNILPTSTDALIIYVNKLNMSYRYDLLDNILDQYYSRIIIHKINKSPIIFNTMYWRYLQARVSYLNDYSLKKEIYDRIITENIYPINMRVSTERKQINYTPNFTILYDYDKLLKKFYSEKSMKDKRGTFTDKYDKIIASCLDSFTSNAKLCEKNRDTNLIKKEIHKFINEYLHCSNTQINVIGRKLNELCDCLHERNRTMCDKLYIDYISRGISLYDCISGNIDIFYDVMINKLIIETTNKIKEGFMVRHCSEFQKYNSLVDMNEINKDPRTNDVALFEIAFGYFVKSTQQELVHKILSPISANISGQSVNYDIHQFLMGKGKTAVITPLLITKIITTLKNKNVIVILPAQLISQSIEIIRAALIFFNGVRVAEFNYNINKNKDVSEFENIMEEYFNIFGGHVNQVVIMSDALLKHLYVTLKTHNFVQELDLLKENNVVIFDEFDTLYDPLKSDFNEILEDTMINTSGILSKNIIAFAVDFIHYAIENKNNTIFDNFDIYAKQLEKFNYSDEFKKIIRKVSDKIYDDPESNTLSLLLKIIDSINELQFNKNYGFPSTISHAEQFIAVPYEFVKTPVPGTKYSDVLITMCTTIFTYIYTYMRHEIRDVDIHNFINMVRVEFGMYKSLGYNPVIFEYVSSDATIDIFDPTIPLEIIVEDIRHKLSLRDMLIYIKKYIIPTIKYTTVFNNCSFIDIMVKEAFKFKIGFSGTINIELPKYLQPSKCEFTQKIPDDDAMGAIYSGLLGVLSDKTEDPVKHSMYDTLENDIALALKDFESDVLIDCGAFFRNYTILDLVEMIHKKIESSGPEYNKSKKDIIYVDSSDKLCKYDRSTNTHSIVPSSTIFDKTSFIIFDNKHTIGTDIKLAPVMEGIITVSKYNGLSIIAQGMYRMRNINFGHNVSFITDIANTNTKIQLLMYLIENDIKYLRETSHKKRLLQNVLYMSKVKDITKFRMISLILPNEFNKRVHNYDVNVITKAYNDSLFVHDDDTRLLIDELQQLPIDIQMTNAKEKSLARIVNVNLNATFTGKFAGHPFSNFILAYEHSYDTVIQINIANLLLRSSLGRALSNEKIRQFSFVTALKKLDIYFSYDINNTTLDRTFFTWNSLYYVTKNNKTIIISAGEFYVLIKRLLSLERSPAEKFKYDVLEQSEGVVIKDTNGHTLYPTDREIPTTIHDIELQLIFGKNILFGKQIKFLVEDPKYSIVYEIIDLLQPAFEITYENKKLRRIFENNLFDGNKTILNMIESINEKGILAETDHFDIAIIAPHVSMSWELLDSGILDELKHKIISELKQYVVRHGGNNVRLKHYRLRQLL